MPTRKTLEADFADGTTATIPVTWVSAPISAGFFAYVVPDAHLTRADALTSVVALDANGNAVGRQTFALTKPLDEDVTKTLPDGTKVSLPRRAQAARAREIVDSRANGARVYVWVMPRTGGGSCYLFGTGYGGGEGCTSPHWLAREPAVNGGLVGGAGNLYFAQVKPDVVAIELRYQNGRSERLAPTDGVVAREISSANQKSGTRLVAAIGFDRDGRVIFTQHLRPLERPSMR